VPGQAGSSLKRHLARCLRSFYRRALSGGRSAAGLAVPAADRREWRRSLWPAFAIGSLICGSMMCWIVALHLTTSLGVGAFLTCLGPLLVPFAGWLLFRQALSKRIGLAMLLALPGIALLVGNSFLQWRFEAGQFWFLVRRRFSPFTSA
jgi:drug/metabolite transporter (DMT)-like permease